MNCPLIFSHFGYQPYLAYTLAQARSSNPGRRLILLGDEHNKHIALAMGWEHFLFEDQSDDVQARFARSYRPIYGQAKRSYHENHLDEKAWYLRWLRYVTERWFFVNAFVSKEGIQRFWHFDSDTMILQDLDTAESTLEGIDYTIQCDNACLNGLICSQVLAEFCEIICSLYEDVEFVQRTQADLDHRDTAAGFSEMEAFEIFRSSSGRRGVWLMEFSQNMVFDDCLCHAHGFSTVELASGKTVKNIAFEDGAAYGWRGDQKFRFATLNLSWLPIHLYMWSFTAYKTCASTTILDVELLENFSSVQFPPIDEATVVTWTNTGVSGDLEFASHLTKLRNRFRHSRKRLVTYAYGFDYLQRQKTVAASAAASGEVGTIESWSFDDLVNTDLFAEKRDILRCSRGQGFWLWKPYIVSRALKSSEDGDLIIYSDCGKDVRDVFATSVLPVQLWLSQGDRRFWIAHEPWPSSTLTKRDCFHYMNCDSPLYWGHRQVSASYFAFLVNSETRRLVAQWLEFCSDARILTDGQNICGSANLPDFIDHRHDQSVLTNLLIREKFTTPAVRLGADVKTKNLGEALIYCETRFRQTSNMSKEKCISTGKTWTASSASLWSQRQGIMSNNDGSTEFFFHTAVEDDPWWKLDLGEISEVTKIVIQNRSNAPFGDRAGRMKVFGGTNDSSEQLLFDAVAAGWDPYTPVVLNLNCFKMKILVIKLDTEECLHLKDVKVFGKTNLH